MRARWRIVSHNVSSIRQVWREGCRGLYLDQAAAITPCDTGRAVCRVASIVPDALATLAFIQANGAAGSCVEDRDVADPSGASKETPREGGA
jgi:hypothetical protein